MDLQDVSQSESAVTKLIALMGESAGFAGIDSSIQTIRELVDDDSGDSRALVSAILRDAPLTSALLRLSNVGGRGTRSVSTIDQAISVLGLSTVDKTAQSLTPAGALANARQLRQLRAEIVAAYFCGTFAALVTRFNGARFKPQETQVAALLQNLGRIMCLYYMNDKVEAARTRQIEKNISESEAVHIVFGMSYEEIGAGLAQAWQLPDGLQLGLVASKGKTQPKASPNPVDWQQVCGLFARHVTDIMFRMPEEREKMEIKNEANFFRQALFLKDDELAEWVGAALGDTDSVMAQADFPLNLQQARTLLRKASERVHDVISPQDSLAKAVGGMKSPIDRINMAMRQLHTEFDYDLTMLLIPEGPATAIAITGIGRHANLVVPKFRCQGPKPDLIRLMMSKMSDIYVPDTTSAAFVKLLPDWYPGQVGAQSMHLTALVQDGTLRGMLYGDYTVARSAADLHQVDQTSKQWVDMIVNALDPSHH